MDASKVFDWAKEVAPKVRDYVGYAFERNFGQMAAALAEAEALEPGVALPVTLKAKLGPGRRFSIEALTWDVRSRRSDKDFWELDLDTRRPTLPGLDEAIAEAEAEERAHKDADWRSRLRQRQDSILERMATVQRRKVAVHPRGDGKVLEVTDNGDRHLAAVPDVEEALAVIDEHGGAIAARERPDGLLELLPHSREIIRGEVGTVIVCNTQAAAESFLGQYNDAWPVIQDIEEERHEA